MKPNTSLNGHRFILTSFSFIIFLCILASINQIRFDKILTLSRCTFTHTSQSFVVILIRQHQSVDRCFNDPRSLPQETLSTASIRYTISGRGQVDVKFVFCNITKEDQQVLVALEIMRYNDVIILNCQEHMNKGKIYTYFSSLPEILNGTTDGQPYHYVMKADDDSYFRLQSLVDSLKPLSRNDLYYGYVIPCPSMDPFVHYMSGMRYLVSWDIVEWIRESDIPNKHLEGPEDRTFGPGLDTRCHRAKNRHNAKWSMYNYPEPPTRCTHELWPETVAVHLLKTQEKWITTLKYFNATQDLKPSRLYHIHYRQHCNSASH